MAASRLNITKLETVSAGIVSVDLAMRSQALGQLMRAAVRPVLAAAKRYVPQPGYPGDKPGLKPLRDTIGIRLRQYERAWVAVVGPQWPAGAHGYNVEYGHRIVLHDGTDTGRTTRPAAYMEPAVAAAGHLAQSEFERRLDSLVRRKWQAA